MRMCQLSRADAEAFYAVHAGRPFFNNLCSFMTSGPIVALELMAASSITKWRDLLGEPSSTCPIATYPVTCHMMNDMHTSNASSCRNTNTNHRQCGCRVLAACRLMAQIL